MQTRGPRRDDIKFPAPEICNNPPRAPPVRRELPTQELGIIAPIKRGVRDCCCVSPQARWRSPRSLIPVPRCHFGTKTGQLNLSGLGGLANGA